MKPAFSTGNAERGTRKGPSDRGALCSAFRVPRSAFTCRHRCGFTLTELLVAVGVSSLLLGVVAILMLYSLRSFTAIGNYVDLDSKSRNALDVMLREIRQATALTAFQDTGGAKSLTLTNADAGVQVHYVWDAGTGRLSVEKTGQPTQLLLSECERWEFKLCQRSPQPNATNAFFLATNVNGTLDPALCKLIDMRWKCSRQILGKKLNTESVQTAQVVLRNKR